MGPKIKGCTVRVGDSEGNFKEVGKAQKVTFEEEKPLSINFNIDIKGPKEIVGEVEKLMPYIGQDFHLYNSESVARHLRKKRELFKPSYINDPIIKEENKMYKSDLDYLTNDRESVDFVLGITKFTERGFVVRLTLNENSKKEFVEYGEDVGQHISNLIHDFIDEIEDEQRKEEQIEYLEEELKRGQERLAELKEANHD